MELTRIVQTYNNVKGNICILHRCFSFVCNVYEVFFPQIAMAFNIDKMLVCYEVINLKLNVKCDENGLRWKMAKSQKFSKTKSLAEPFKNFHVLFFRSFLIRTQHNSQGIKAKMGRKKKV